MKKMLWIHSKVNLEFNLNWMERILLTRIIKERRVGVLKSSRGRHIKTVIIDEASELTPDVT